MRRTALLLCLAAGLPLAGCALFGEDVETKASALDRGTYVVHDYELSTADQVLAYPGLADGDRLLVIPFYPRDGAVFVPGGGGLPAVGADPAQETYRALTMTVEYGGGAIATRAARHPDWMLNPASGRLPEKRPPTNEQALSRSTDRGAARAIDYAVNDSVLFWVYDDYDAGTFTQAAARCLFKGTHCYVFFTDDLAARPNAVSRATQLGQGFDTAAYPAVTSAIGYEWGGDPAKPQEAGGIDGDPRVFILVNGVTRNPPGGLFSGRNESDGEASNRKEMFEVFMDTAKLATNYCPSDTLAHEFQHLVCHNYAYRRTGESQTAFFNEGFSQLAEDVSGYGPLLHRFGDLFRDPHCSYALWDYTSTGYASAYAIAAYAYRRFGPAFVKRVSEGARFGVAGFEDALAASGYTGDYSRFVLDALTACWLDRDEFRLPAQGATAAIDPRATAKAWYWYGPSTNWNSLHGPRTTFAWQFPQSYEVSLHRYGGEYYEFASGPGGTLTLRLADIAPGTRLRVIVLRSGTNARPVVDGSGLDWAGLPGVVAVADAAGDNDMTSVHTGTFGAPASDIRRFSALSTNGTWYLLWENSAPASADSGAATYIAYFKVNVGPSYDYRIDFYDWEPYVYYLSGSNWIRTNANVSGVASRAGNAFEARVPHGIFAGTVPATCKVRGFAASFAGGGWVWDYTDADLDIPW